ncbi:MAG: branched-chain amino acid transaminase [Anaerolineales bacterium]|nr:branched-chain amino acid transaminase [Anaerolineales bacterium]
MTLPKFAFFKGKIVPYEQAKVGVLTHTLNYGTGVFGGLRAYWNERDEQLYLFRPTDHFRRFLDSTRLLCMELPHTPEQLTEVVVELLRLEKRSEDTYVRPLAIVPDEVVGVRLHDLHADISIVSVPMGRYIESEEGSSVTFSSWRRVDDNAIPARGKIIGSYVNSAFIKTDAMRGGYDEAIVLNPNGHISEGSAENFFMVKGGMLVTPPVTENILEGITRRTVIQLAREELGMAVVERPIDRTEVYLAEEAFFCGTGVQICAISRVDKRLIADGKMGPFVTKLRDLYFRIVRGMEPKFRAWNVPIYPQGAGG